MDTKEGLERIVKDTVALDSEDCILNAYIKAVSKYKLLTHSEQLNLAKKAKLGDKNAKRVLIQANLRLVINIVKKCIHKTTMPLIDLIQEGNLGLMVAVEKFNYKLGYKFSTYAAWWIKQAIFKAISEQSYSMKIPVYIQETLSKFSKLKSELEKMQNNAVSNEVIAKQMNISPEKIDLYLTAYTKSLSIEAPYELQNGNNVSLSEILLDEKSNVNTNIEKQHFERELNYLFSKLKEREVSIVRMRYGLRDEKKKTLEEIGKIYGISKECVRQTELRAIAKLRRLAHSEDKLLSYI